jgi:hypothetical protein
MNLAEIKQIAQTEMADKRSSPYNERGDKYTHGERVAALCLRLRRLIFPNEGGYDHILTVAAWFHDICNGGEAVGAAHAVLGAERVRELLAGHCRAEELEEICGLIAVHDDRKTEHKTYSNAVRIHQDADHLDHFGTFDIWRCVAYTIGHNETVNEALYHLQNKWPADNARWRTELHFDLSRKIFDEKTEFFKSFIERFAVEGKGGIWREDTLLGM